MSAQTIDTEVSRLAVNGLNSPLVYFKEDDEGRAEVYKDRIRIGISDKTKGEANFTSIGHNKANILISGFNSQNEEEWLAIFQLMTLEGKVVSALTIPMTDSYDELPLCIRMFDIANTTGALVMRCARYFELLAIKGKKLIRANKIDFDSDAFNCGAIVKQGGDTVTVVVANDIKISVVTIRL